MKILLLEEEKMARIGLVPLLKARGHVVDEVETADNAIEMLRTESYDLLIFDVILDKPSQEIPGVPLRELGKMVLLHLRNNNLGKVVTSTDVPVIVITAIADQVVKEQLRAIANTLILFKPIAPDDALFEIESYLSNKGGENA